jgi:hypothetical protein
VLALSTVRTQCYIDLLAMSGPMYFTDNGRDVPAYHFLNDPEFKSNGAYPIESAIISHAQVHLHQFSPTQRYRQDSLFSCSDSSGAKSTNTSPHQAEAEPCIQATQMATQGSTMHPVSMERTASQFSSSSGGQHYHDRHRAPFAQLSISQTAGLSRPSTRCSNLSTSYQTHSTAPPQPSLAHMQLDQAGHTSPDAEYTLPTTLSTCNVPLSPTNPANSVYTSEMEDIRSFRPTDVSGMGELFGQSAAYDE